LIILPDDKYKTIYADPPWPEHGGGKIKRGADRHYNLMSVKEIKSMPVIKIAEENSHLYLWVTNNYIENGLEVMKAWGFTYKTKITWVKGERLENGLIKLENPGLGQYYRGLDEVCLFGARGFMPYKVITGRRQQGTTVLIAPRGKHSEKPKEMYEQIEKVSYPEYIELFARNIREGWTSWGNEVSECAC